MITKINTKEDYRLVQTTVESYLRKATQGGGFASLSEADDEELVRLSHLVRDYELQHYPMPSQPTLMSTHADSDLRH